MWPSPSPPGRGHAAAAADAASLGQPIRRQRAKPPPGPSLRSPHWPGSLADRDGLPTVGGRLPGCTPATSSRSPARSSAEPYMHHLVPRMAALPGVDGPSGTAAVSSATSGSHSSIGLGISGLGGSVSSGVLLPGGLSGGVPPQSHGLPSGPGPPPRRGPSLPQLGNTREDDSGRSLRANAEPRRLPPLCRSFNSYEVTAESPCSMASNESEASTVASESEDWDEKEILVANPPGSFPGSIFFGTAGVRIAPAPPSASPPAPTPDVIAPATHSLCLDGLARIEQAEAEAELQSPGRPGLPSPPVPPPPVVPPLAFVPAAECEQILQSTAAGRAGSVGAYESFDWESSARLFEPTLRREWLGRLDSRGTNASRTTSRCRSRDRPISRACSRAGCESRGARPRSSSAVGRGNQEAWSPPRRSREAKGFARSPSPWAPRVPSPPPVPDGPAGPLWRAPHGEGAHGPWVQLL